MITTLTLHPDDLDAFRLMLRETLAGDYELLGELRAGVTVSTPEVYGETPTLERVALVERVAADVGGLY
jgi:hypothetical protein